jgi:hypothetical protein
MEHFLYLGTLIAVWVIVALAANLVIGYAGMMAMGQAAYWFQFLPGAAGRLDCKRTRRRCHAAAAAAHWGLLFRARDARGEFCFLRYLP